MVVRVAWNCGKGAPPVRRAVAIHRIREAARTEVRADPSRTWAIANCQISPEPMQCPTCGGEHVGRFFKRPKSKASRRWVPLALPAREVLEAHPMAAMQLLT
jgi:hypothetical protein